METMGAAGHGLVASTATSGLPAPVPIMSFELLYIQYPCPALPTTLDKHLLRMGWRNIMCEFP